MHERQTYAYLIRPTRLEMLSQGPTAEEDAVVSRHADYLAHLAEQGQVIFVGRALVTDERTFGMVVFRVEDETEAQSVVANDPAVQAGVMRPELLPFRLLHMSPAMSAWLEV